MFGCPWIKTPNERTCLWVCCTDLGVFKSDSARRHSRFINFDKSVVAYFAFVPELLRCSNLDFSSFKLIIAQ